ncbi:4Fe-4S dicluster domain-containing protein [Desulfitobacterium sp. THU1]|uniref:4Fe-4S dicluster domain-containing protein n=1 Tax=Desulfitobacterium sp. THU1 TaxID=3138072 RepID=UPI00311EAFB7
MKISRRRFLERLGAISALGIFAPFSMVTAETYQRPPGALNEKEFLAQCIRCLKCGEQCPTGAITFSQSLKGGVIDTPILRDKDQCNLCMNCIRSCPTGALRPLTENPELQAKKAQKMYSKEHDTHPSFNLGVAQLQKDKCILYHGRNRKCLLCYEVCPLKDEALYTDDRGRPIINKIVCYGCGLCEIACPPIAITMPLSREDKRSHELFERINQGSFYESRLPRRT